MGLNAAARLMGGYASLRTSSTESESGDPSDDKDRPLLPKEEEDLDTVPLHRLHHHKRKTSWARRHPFLIHGVLLILNLLVAISYGFWSFSSCVVDPAHRYFAGRNVIRYEGRAFELGGIYQDDGTANPKKPTHFNGPPRPELDKAWDDLIGIQNIRLTRTQMSQFSTSTSLLRLADSNYTAGTTYWTTISVFHGLHCVKRLHHYIHKDHYYPDLPPSESQRLLEHTEHCLDWLRQYVQCNADTTLIPLHFAPTERLPVALDDGEHQCVAWEPLERWVRERSFNPRTPGLVVHPVFGEVFGEGKGGDSIGITGVSGLIHDPE